MASGMVGWTLDNPDYQRRVARLVDVFPAGSDALAPGYGQALVEAMVDRGEIAPAFMVQQTYGRRSHVAGFAGGFTYRPIDWTTADNFEIGSNLIERPTPRVHFFAEQGSQGVFLWRLAALPPGRYRLSFAVEKAADDTTGTVALTLSCQTPRADRPFSRSRVALASGRFAQTFTIPPRSCPFQWLRFSVASRQGSVAADLTGVAIDRVG